MKSEKLIAGVLIVAGGVLAWGYLHGHTRNLTERPEGDFAGMAVDRPARTASAPSAGSGATTVDGEAPVMVYKLSTCGCCSDWIEHLREDGFAVQAEDVVDLGRIKERYGVTRELGSCHTAIVGGYVVEGHVPAADLRRLLEERPENVVGLAVPGMPIGSPGMEQGDQEDPFDVIAFKLDGTTEVWSSHNQ